MEAQSRNWGARLRPSGFFGIPALTLETETLRVTVLDGKGGDLVELLHKPSDTDFAWLTADCANAARRVSRQGAGLSFMDGYLGGWQEVLPNGGAPAVFAGAAFDQHGDVATQPWTYDVLADTQDEVAVQLSVRSTRTPLRLDRTMRLRRGEPELRVTSTLTNESKVAVPAMWGQHITFGPPFLHPGCRIRLPEGVRVIPHPTALHPPRRRVAPDIGTWPVLTGPDGHRIDLSVLPDPGTDSDLVYLTGFTEGWYEVLPAGDGPGIRIEWDADTMPYLWFWQEFGATTGYPWYGRHYNIGLEPFSSYPTDGLTTAVHNGTALTVNPDERRGFALSARVFEATR
ncbi:DUF4432 family protein [Actinocrispum wychmicini]|uniref:Uncharacterized protein DUF4432 n=1 Tax=Actinocrispum wychmicini TaxID=1213861 RepID=A0A4R2J9A2_9PSEU|nr:DUF4432 family protein [Actinocrispum wychmicini]TCO55891.1 uncharacterized protein DUF4432 [Actinocrispum wychmicini]